MLPMDERQRDPIREAHRQWVRHGWADAADGMVMVTTLVRAQQLLLERIDAVLRPLELTFARYEVLRLISFSSAGSMPMTRLGSLLQVHPTSVTSAVDRLERQGFVERQRRDDDRRVVLAAITDAGRAVVDKATDGLNGEVFERPGLDATQLEALTGLLGVLRARGDTGRHRSADHDPAGRASGARAAPASGYRRAGRVLQLLGHPTWRSRPMSELHVPKRPVRLVTASSLFDGHDASINIMRRIFMAQGCEVVHLGHNRSVQEVVDAAIEEDVQGVAVSSYQGGHIEYFEYLVESLKARGAEHVHVVGGGGGVIVHDEIERLRGSGVTIFSPEDGQRLGLPGMINSVVADLDFDLWDARPVTAEDVISGDRVAIARAITGVEAGRLDEADQARR